jgi:hypothetical protein
LPVSAPTDNERSRAEAQEIAEEHDLLVYAGAHESGRKESTEKRKESDALGVSAECEESREDGDEDEGDETGLWCEKRVVLTACPDRDKERGFAEARDAFGKVNVAACEKPLAPRQHEDTEEDADGHTAGGTDPVVVEGQFEEIGNGEEKRNDTDAIEPAAADEGFEIGG